MAKKVIDLIENPEATRERSQAALNIARSLSPEKIGNLYLQHYEEILGLPHTATSTENASVQSASE